MVMFSEQVPPHALEAEQAIIGACLLSRLGRMTCIQQLRPTDFYSERHRRLFEAIVELDASGAVEPYLVADRLHALGRLEEVGGVSYLMSCMNACISPDVPDALVALVREKAARRRLITALTRARTIAQDESRPLDEVQSEVEGLVLGARETEAEALDPEDWAHDVETEAALVAAGQEGRPRVRTGYRYVDHTLKLWPGKLTTLSGGTSQGKTATVVSFGLGAARLGYRVHFWSGEMEEDELWSRMAAAEVGIRYEDLEERRLTTDQVRAIKDYARQLKELPLSIVDKPRSVSQIRAECRQIAEKEGRFDLLVVDYLGLLDDMNRENAGSDRRDLLVGRVVWSLRQLARELHCHVILVAQFNRDPGKRASSRPRITDLKEGSVIEQHSDAVVLVYRPERDEALSDEERARYARRLELIIAKQRHGKTGSIWLDYDADHQRIITLHHQEWPGRPSTGTKRGKGE